MISESYISLNKDKEKANSDIIKLIECVCNAEQL